MKILMLISILAAIGCGSNNQPMTFNISDTGLIDSGSIAIAPNGDYVVAGNVDDTNGKIITSSDGKIWITRQLFSNNGLSIGLGRMITIGQSIYVTVASGPYTINGYYHTIVWKSIDNGITWLQVSVNTQYIIMWSHIVIGTKVAVALYAVPQTGYKYAWVDFGWYDTSTDTVSYTSRLVTTGDQPSFPSETFIYQRPVDGALVAIVRWGESPNIPYSMLYLSQDNGTTWTSMNVTWQGLAGNIVGCNSVNGEYWFAGYQEDSRANVSSAVWKIDPNTGNVQGMLYPLGAGIYGTKGNGGIACKGTEVDVLLGNGTLQFVSFQE